MTSTQSTSTSDPIWDEALGRIKRRIDDTLASGLAGFPHYGEPATGQWVTTADGSWTGGFWVGELWLAGHYWSDPVYAREAERWLRKLESRIESKSVFRGFLFYYGAVPGASVAKNPYAREIVLRSGATLAKAFNSTVGLIPLGTAAEEAHSVGDDKTNIDSLIASPLLLRAANANGDASLRRIALAHALIFQCRLFGDTPYLPARARRRERPSSIVRPEPNFSKMESARSSAGGTSGSR